MMFNFKERWAFVCAVLITACIVYLMPLGRILQHKCHCSKELCPSNPEHRAQDKIIREDIRLRLSDNTSMTRKTFEPSHSSSCKIPLHKDGWVLDCVTWEPKWESPTLDADPHEFSIDNIPKEKQLAEDRKHRERTFVEIFKKKDWPANDPSYKGLQVSGPGAMLKNAQGAMAALHVIITKLKQYLQKPIISILDLPCGDLQWMKPFLLTRNDVQYTGADIVADIIEHHRRSHISLQRTSFIQHDIVNTPLNESFDLIICRDMLQHLWKYDAIQALYHFSASKSLFLLATTFPDTTQNNDVEKDALGGRKFSYNLELPPFSLEPPVCSSYDWNIEHLSLWSLPLKQKYEL